MSNVANTFAPSLIFCRWLFRPIEAIAYCVRIPILVASDSQAASGTYSVQVRALL